MTPANSGRLGADPPGVEERVDGLDWAATAAELDASGHALSALLLAPTECSTLAGLWDEPGRFRSSVDMARQRFGSGTYRYFAYPLPDIVAELREAFFPHLLPIARDWAARLDWPAPWPGTFAGWLDACHQAGQDRPTPLLFSYGPGDWNALHRDLYGEQVFPLQVVIGLDRPGDDYQGGELLMVEQRPRAQSRGYSATLAQGQAMIFTTRDRPVRSTRGWSTAPMRHGVSTIQSGTRRTLGIIFQRHVTSPDTTGSAATTRCYTLVGADGHPYSSLLPGSCGGHRRGRRYGRLDCPAALRAIARGGYVADRVFFANAEDAIAAGYRPCAVCLPMGYADWKQSQGEFATNRRDQQELGMVALHILQAAMGAAPLEGR